MKEVILSQPIKGEIYINGDKKSWRIVILKWIKENQTNDTFRISLGMIITYLKKSGITFNQNDQLIKHPILHFLSHRKR